MTYQLIRINHIYYRWEIHRPRKFKKKLIIWFLSEMKLHIWIAIDSKKFLQLQEVIFVICIMRKVEIDICFHYIKFKLRWFMYLSMHYGYLAGPWVSLMYILVTEFTTSYSLSHTKYLLFLHKSLTELLLEREANTTKFTFQ